MNSGILLELSDEIGTLSEAFRYGLQSILDSKLVGVYLYGAVAFPIEAPIGDIDYHVIIKEKLTVDERSAARAPRVACPKVSPSRGGTGWLLSSPGRCAQGNAAQEPDVEQSDRSLLGFAS
jgi:hypothetical protein